MIHDRRRRSAADVVEQQWERRPDGTPVRVLRDGATGRKWRVWLMATGAVPGALEDSCLVFDTGDLMRRVWRVPDDWARMPPDALVRLTEAAPERRREARRGEARRDAADERRVGGPH
jgi:hypothetical protein